MILIRCYYLVSLKWIKINHWSCTPVPIFGKWNSWFKGWQPTKKLILEQNWLVNWTAWTCCQFQFWQLSKKCKNTTIKNSCPGALLFILVVDLDSRQLNSRGHSVVFRQKAVLDSVSCWQGGWALFSIVKK